MYPSAMAQRVLPIMVLMTCSFLARGASERPSTPSIRLGPRAFGCDALRFRERLDALVQDDRVAHARGGLGSDDHDGAAKRATGQPDGPGHLTADLHAQ